MTKEELLQNAKLILLPDSATDENPSWTGHDNEYIDFMSNHEYIKLTRSSIDDIYLGYPTNGHHFKLQYHLQNTIPAMQILFHLLFEKDDFNIIDCPDGDYKVQVMMPKCIFPVKVNAYKSDKCEDGCIYISKDDYTTNINELFCLMSCANTVLDPLSSMYHRQFKYTHQSAVIENLGPNNGKTILISCDSHVAPIVPIICKYYQKVIIMDNRIRTVSMWDFYQIENEKIDDILILGWVGNMADKFLKENLI